MSKQHPEEPSIKEQVINSLKQTENNQQRTKDSMDDQEVTGSRSNQNRTGKLPNKKGSPKKSKHKKESSTEKYSRQKEDKLVNRIVLIVVVTLIFVLGISGFSIYRYVTSSLEPLNPKNKEVVFVEVPIGSSNKMIGEILEENKIIKNGTIFNFFTKFNNLSGFQAGRFQFSQSMTLDEISSMLKEGGLAADQADARIAIPEGYDVSQIGDVIETETDFSKDEFLSIMTDKKIFDKLKGRYSTLLADADKAKGVRYPLEGYLF